MARPGMSDRAIAEYVGVSDRMVAKYRAERAGRDGRTIDTANIGKAKADSPEPPDPDDIPLDLPQGPLGAQAPAPPAGGYVTKVKATINQVNSGLAFRRFSKT